MIHHETKKKLKEALEKMFNRLWLFIFDLPSDSPTNQNTYHHNGKTYIAVEGKFCTNCSFYTKSECDHLKCTPAERGDKKQVVWKESIDAGTPAILLDADPSCDNKG